MILKCWDKKLGFNKFPNGSTFW